MKEGRYILYYQGICERFKAILNAPGYAYAPSIRAYGCAIMRLSPGHRFSGMAGVLEPGAMRVAGQIGEQLWKYSRHIGNTP
jgi:hypothetical protein